MKIFLLLLITASSAVAQTNTVTDPNGDVFSATSDFGYYWKGFGTGLMVYGFGWIVRMARKTASDY